MPPPRSAWDPRLARVIAFPADLTAFFADHPYVHVRATTALSLGGISAQQIDVVAEDGDPKARSESLCGETSIRDSPCVPISADRDEEGFVSLALDPGTPYRLIDLQTPKGRLIIVVDGFDRFGQLAGAERVIRTLRIGK